MVVYGTDFFPPLEWMLEWCSSYSQEQVVCFLAPASCLAPPNF